MQDTTLADALRDIFAADITKAVLSKPQSGAYQKITLTKKAGGLHVEKFTDKQAFHENIPCEEAVVFCQTALQTDFRQLNAWDTGAEYMLSISKKGKVLWKRQALTAPSAPAAQGEHNRRKNHILEEGVLIPPLYDMGVLTREGKVVQSMYDKFKQLNRFLEIIGDALKGRDIQRLNVIDFGCGKSYLTFVLYHYLTEICGIEVHIIGLDLKADVIQKCNEAAARYHYDGLHFEQGDIRGYACPFAPDMVITLHACDTATDYALHSAIQWGADMIFSVPCCQHELNAQMETEALALFRRYGIIQERTAALLTDAIRANLLEAVGYKAQVLEFIDIAHTPKNLLLRATRRPANPGAEKRALREVEAAMAAFHVQPTLHRLLAEAGKIPKPTA